MELAGVGNERNDDILASINTPAKLLKAISDLHEIIQAQPKYKDFNPQWKGTESPEKVLLYMLRKIGPLAGGKEWFIDCHSQSGVPQFSLVIYQSFPNYHVKCRNEYMPLDFLPGLKSRDEELHNLIIDTVALVTKHNRVPLWDEDGHYSEAIKDLVTKDQTSDHLARQKEIYSKGIAKQYLNTIRRRQKVVNIDQHDKAVDRYIAGSNRKIAFRYWMKLGVRLARTGGNIIPFILARGVDAKRNDILYPHQLYKFIWSCHPKDVINRRVERKINGHQYSLPVVFSRTRPGEKIKPIEMGDYPVYNYDFMSFGVRHVLWTFRDYYYKKLMESKTTPTDTLLEKLSIEEFINTK